MCPHTWRRIFRAGGDIKTIASDIWDKSPDEISKIVTKYIDEGWAKLVSIILDFHKPIVSVVRGVCYGISLLYVNLADFVYCTADAKFCLPIMTSH